MKKCIGENCNLYGDWILSINQNHNYLLHFHYRFIASSCSWKSNKCYRCAVSLRMSQAVNNPVDESEAPSLPTYFDESESFNLAVHTSTPVVAKSQQPSSTIISATETSSSAIVSQPSSSTNDANVLLDSQHVAASNSLIASIDGFSSVVARDED
jgi:hypothetical protein